MLTWYNKTIVARCDLGSMGSVHLWGKMAPSALPGAIFPLGCTKRHGPCHSVQRGPLQVMILYFSHYFVPSDI